MLRLRKFSTLLTLGLVLPIASCDGVGPTRPSMNIILVVVDTLRQDHVGTYGYERATTPGLDARAAKGLVFERCVAQAPWTAASMASMFTSKIPSQTGVGAIEDSTGRRHIVAQSCSSLPLEETTLAEVMQEAGYRTAAVTTNPFLSPQFGISQGFETHMKGRLPAKNVVDSALVWLADPDTNGNARPYFLYLHFMDVHAPNNPPGDFRRMFSTLDGKRHRQEHARGGRISAENTSPKELRIFKSHKEALYDGSLAYVDQQLDRLFQHLETTGQLDKTVVFFTADHGEGLWDHGGGGGHGASQHREQTDIPLIAFGADVPQRRVDELVRGLDVAPTILEFAGIEIPDGFTGVPLRQALKAGLDDSLEALSEDLAYGLEQKSLEQSGWKVIVDHTGKPTALYDRRTDPEERRNRIAEEQDRANALAQRLTAILEAAGKRERRGLEIDEQTKEQLRTLGY